MSLRHILYNIGGKLLLPFVKAQVNPVDISSLGIDITKPVIYVLENRGWTDLTVLSDNCPSLKLPSPMARISQPHFSQWHSVYTVAQKQPFKAWLLNTPKRSVMLCEILKILKDNPEDDVQFVPVSIFWGRPVAKQKHWLHVLFADSWAIAGRTRKAFTILFNGRQTLINYSSVIHFRDFIKNDIDDDNIISNVQEHLTTRLLEMRAATLGPDVSHRRTLIRELLSNEDLRQEINYRKKADGLSDLKAALIARRYLYEIVADCTSITISLMQRGLTKFWNRFYSGIEVNGSAQLPELALTHSLVYVPCHRSHVDYLLLSYIIHSNALAIPYIAAGKNLKMPIIGPILRGGGAFFIRRSFKDNALYSAALFEYLALLISKGVSTAYFIEGGRSRSGRLLAAKPGMLSMTVRAFLKYRTKPVAFIPVYIGYEKMIEGSSYASELSGKQKKSETLLRSIRNMLNIRGEFGRVYTNFAEPILLENILDTTINKWQNDIYDDTNRPRWLRTVISTLSQQIQTHINAAASVNPVNLLATILLTSSNHRMDECVLESLLDSYTQLLDKLHYADTIKVTSQTGKEQIRYVESLKLVLRKQHELGDIIYIGPSNTSLMPYYRNNVLHLFILPSVIACCFNTVRTTGHEKIKKLVKIAYPYLKSEFFLKWDELEIDDAIDHTLDVMVTQGLIIKNDALDVYTKPGSSTTEFSQLELLSQILSPVLELYYLTISILFKIKNDSLTLDKVNDYCYLMAQHMSLVHELNPHDFADKQLIKNLINALIDNKYLKINRENHLEVNQRFMEADKETRLLINTNIRNKLLQLIKNQPHHEN